MAGLRCDQGASTVDGVKALAHRRVYAIGLVLSVCMAIAWTGTVFGVGASRAADVPESCADRTVVDYLSPFRRWRRPNPPSAQSLPFGPPTFSLTQASTSRVFVSGHGGFGYVAQLGEMEALNAQLNWQVTASLQRLDKQGQVKYQSARRSWHIGRARSLNNRTFVIPVGPKPGLFRYQLSFKLPNDRVWLYSQYVRVVPARVEVVLDGLEPSYRIGESLIYRVANLGTVPVSTSGRSTVSYWNGADWEAISTTSQSRRGERLARELLGGEGGPCQHVQLASGLSSGKYRVDMEYEAGFGGQSVTLAREFELVP
jgi:hypothetical protein